MVRRRLLVLTITLLILGVMYGSVSAEKTKIVIWTYFAEIHNELLPEFYKQFPDVELEIMSVGGATTAEKYLVAYVGGAGPDIVTLRLGQSVKYIESGMVAPVDPRGFGVNSLAELERMMLPGSMSILRHRDGNVYFMPAELSIFGFFYNKTLMDQAGVGKVPTTWEELLEVGQKFVKVDADGKTQQVGLYMWREWFPPWFFHILMQGYNVQPFTADGQSQFSHPDAVKAISLYPELYRRLSNNTDMGGHNRTWNAGNAAFNWGANYMSSGFKKADLMFEWGSAPMPKFAQGQPSTVAYAHGHFVNSQSKHKELAWKVVGFFIGPQQAEKWYTEHNLWQPWGGSWITRLFIIDPTQRPFLEQLEFAVPEIAHPNVDDLYQKIREAEDRIFRGKQSVEAALQQLDTEISAMGPIY
ncbi:MAG: extracellular solute-binding protein [Limnochordia bacterium]